MGCYLKVFKQYANFKGRASRKEFWMFFLYHSLILLVLFFTQFCLINSDNVGSYFGIVFPFLLSIYFFITLTPTLAVTVRRLHDTDKSGIWVIVPFSILWLFLIIHSYIANLERWSIGFGLFTITFGIILLVFLLKKGADKENEWGQIPMNGKTHTDCAI